MKGFRSDLFHNWSKRKITEIIMRFFNELFNLNDFLG